MRNRSTIYFNRRDTLKKNNIYKEVFLSFNKFTEIENENETNGKKKQLGLLIKKDFAGMKKKILYFLE